MKERYSYVVLAAMGFLLTIFCVLFSINESNAHDHKFCELVNALTIVPVVKPANPSANPEQERAWIIYSDFVDLKNSLGC